MRSLMNCRYLFVATFLLTALWSLGDIARAGEGGYAVVISKTTQESAPWSEVADALLKKHNGRLIVHDGELEGVLAPLRESFPRYCCFVAKPDEVTRNYVAKVHRLTRRVDDDPFTDLFWGILTGFDAEDALRTASETEPLIIERVAAGTEIELNACQEGVWFCELEQRRIVRKRPGDAPVQERGEVDSTAAIVDTLNDYQPQLFVTSGHATEADWQIGFRYRNGSFRSEAGSMFGLDTGGTRHPIQSNNPKVYLAVGNCLMGHINGPDAMALAWMHSVGVRQMVGYTVLTWHGYGGWGCLDYFVEQPGRFTLTEAFFANQHALVHKLHTEYPDLADKNPEPGQAVSYSDGGGLLHDRDVVAFYGDPAWQARLAEGPCAWDQSLTETDGIYTLTITPNLQDETFDPVNTNGSQRGYRPIIAWLPHRVENVEIVAGSDWKPVITDNFVLVPLPRDEPVPDLKVISFTADRIDLE